MTVASLPMAALTGPEEAWLRRRAHSLARDPGLAEDLVQEVLLLALRRSPASVLKLRPWMNQVLLRCFQRAHRTLDRRRRREERVAREESLPPATELLERGETRFAVMEAILDLDWRDREVLFLTYYQGHRVSSLAERFGVPVATVKSRLRRAEERLRCSMLTRGLAG